MFHPLRGCTARRACCSYRLYRCKTGKPTTSQCDDGAPASEESAQMKINKQLNYATPVCTPQ
eukprot:scaffold133345_cov60-Phaeocystis_antarctica.AAC.1